MIIMDERLHMEVWTDAVAFELFEDCEAVFFCCFFYDLAYMVVWLVRATYSYGVVEGEFGGIDETPVIAACVLWGWYEGMGDVCVKAVGECSDVYGDDVVCVELV